LAAVRLNRVCKSSWYAHILFMNVSPPYMLWTRYK